MVPRNRQHPSLEDRLLHLPVEDPRQNKKAKAFLAQLIVDGVGLEPQAAKSMEMQELLTTQVLPMYDILDKFAKGGTTAGATLKGKSVRNLIGQARMRQIETPELAEFIVSANRAAITAAKYQYVVLPNGKNVDAKYLAAMPKIPKDKLTSLQLTNLQINEQLIQMETIRSQKEGPVPDDEPDDIFSAL